MLAISYFQLAALERSAREAWDLGLRDRDGLVAYVEARVVAGARPWSEAIERCPMYLPTPRHGGPHLAYYCACASSRDSVR